MQTSDPHRQRLASRFSRTSWKGRHQILFLVDAEMADHVFQHVWSLDSDGYLLSEVGGGKRMRLHRFIWHRAHGFLPDMLDHINGVRWDCRLCNLRPATPSLNTRNRRVDRKYDLPRGVGLRCGPDRNGPRPYRARIRFGGKYHLLGYFSTPGDAAAAYDEACLRISRFESASAVKEVANA